MNDGVSVLVVSCDAYRDLWQPFFHCFHKYWPDCPYAVRLGSNECRHADERVSPVLVGTDQGFASNLLRMLDQIPEEWILLWIEDRVLAAPVDTRRIGAVVEFARGHDAGFVKLISSPPFARAKGTAEFGEIEKGIRYRVCMTVGLWNKRTLRAILKPGESPWQTERAGSVRSDRLAARFFALTSRSRRRPPLVDMHLIIKGRLMRHATRFLRNEELLDELASRPLQTRTSALYVRAYLLMQDVKTWLGDSVRGPLPDRPAHGKG